MIMALTVSIIDGQISRRAAQLLAVQLCTHWTIRFQNCFRKSFMPGSIFYADPADVGLSDYFRGLGHSDSTGTEKDGVSGCSQRVADTAEPYAVQVDWGEAEAITRGSGVG